jgi:hypothetical protein
MSPYERCTWICLHPGMPPADASGVPWWEQHNMSVVMLNPATYERLKWAGDLTDAEQLLAQLVEQAAGVMEMPLEDEP